ncbi:Nicotinamide/nicotinic acid mononucleotide adenylyltransferase 1 [Blomia tropicalis]|nr:Nicotinamide/nicotinic acid mononucleotide adenylyltransferase 1 [Blomia tropicalis]
MSRVVIIACGSFNPPTNMHLRMFELAKDFLVNKNHQVIEGIISPVNDNYPTSKFLAPSNHRCEMIRRACSNYWVQLDDWECCQPKWSRTLEVLRYHKVRLQKKYDEMIQLKMLCGADLFETFNVPNLWQDNDIEEIVRDYGLIVITRNGSDPWNTLKNSPKSGLLSKYEDNIVIVKEKFINNISSSLIREAILNRESIRYLVDDKI